jgi:hypothetical protein
MYVKSISVTDYSTGSQYKYSDESGSWQSIQAVGGSVNGNAGASVSVATSAPAVTATPDTAEPIPWSGTHRETSSFSTPSIWPWVPGSTSSLTDAVPTGWPSGGSASPPSAVSVSRVPLKQSFSVDTDAYQTCQSAVSSSLSSSGSSSQSGGETETETASTSTTTSTTTSTSTSTSTSSASSANTSELSSSSDSSQTTLVTSTTSVSAQPGSSSKSSTSVPPAPTANTASQFEVGLVCAFLGSVLSFLI